MQQLRRPLLTGRQAADASAPRNRGASVVQSIFNLTKNIVGIGLLSLPAAVAAGTGLAPAVLLTVALGVYSAYTFSLYGRVCQLTGERNFHGLGMATGGTRWARFLCWSCTLRTVFACLAFSLVVADSFSSVLTGMGAPPVLCDHTTVLGGISLFVILPLCLLPNLSALAMTSLLGVAAMLYTVLFMIVRCLDGSYAPGGRFHDFQGTLMAPAAIDPWCVNVSTLVLVSSLGHACSAHYNAPKYWEQLRSRSVGRFNTVVAVSFGIAVALCLAAMCAGYLTFGTAAKGNILLNYSNHDPLATAARLAVAGSVVVTYPLAFTGLRDGVMSLLGLSPSARNFRLSTLALLALVKGLAVLIRNVGFVVNLSGAIFGALTVYIFPSLLFLLAPGRKAGPESELAKVTVLNGAGLALLGTTVAVLKEFAPALLP